MEFNKTYNFTRDEALKRIKALTGYWSAKYGVAIEWDAFDGQVKGKVRGVKFNGVIRVDEGRVHADVKAGFLAETLGGKAYVNRKLDDYLNPGNRVEDLEARIP